MSNNEENEGLPQDSPFPDLEDLQREVEKRIRDNQRFLERYLKDDFLEEDKQEGEI